MTADWGPLDTLMARAEALAGAWGARARASTTIGQERAILRLFGVSGLDASGRPLAGATIDRWLAGDPHGLGTGIALPFAMALLEYDLEPQPRTGRRLGAIDLALEAELLREPDRRASRGRGRASGGPCGRCGGPPHASRDDRHARRGAPAVARRHAP
jgi:hypothetical protein